MKAKIALTLCVICVLLLMSCASSPPPERTSSDDCLVIIKTEIINPQMVPTARAFKFDFSGAYPSVFIGNAFTAAKIGEPGVEIKTVSTFVRGQSMGASAKINAGIALPYKPGQLVIADFVFVITYTKVDEHTYGSGISLRKITESERGSILEDLRSSGDYSGWMNQE